MANIKILAPFIQSWEGGFANDPDDNGGATMKGITISTYTDYCRRKGKKAPTVADLKRITDQEWLDIMKTMYWDPWQADNEEAAFLLIMQYFNKCVHLYRSDIKPVRALTEDRRQKLRVILNKYQSAHLRTAVSNAMQSDFLNGRTKRRKAAADFDWIMEEKHFVQCIENSL